MHSNLCTQTQAASNTNTCTEKRSRVFAALLRLFVELCVRLQMKIMNELSNVLVTSIVVIMYQNGFASEPTFDIKEANFSNNAHSHDVVQLRYANNHSACCMLLMCRPVCICNHFDMSMHMIQMTIFKIKYAHMMGKTFQSSHQNYANT